MKRVLILFAMLFGIHACALPGGVSLDPRDEAAVEEWENSCDRTSGMVRLDVKNHYAGDVVLTLLYRQGGNRTLRPKVTSTKQSYRVPRGAFESTNAIHIRVASGGPGTQEALVGLEPLMCDVGTLEIGPTVNLSFFIGAEWD